MRRRTVCACVLAMLMVAQAAAGLWEDIFQGLDYLATPLGTPLITTADGTRINGARSGRVRIVPNGVFGDGYRLEFDRTFGPDSQGRPETLWLGPWGDVTLQGSTQATAAYNCAQGFCNGTLNFVVNGLNYDLRTKLGAQDAELFGTLNVNNFLEVNSLGFYNLTLNISNTNSQFLLDGVIVEDEEDTNFDVGPIVIEGNIFYDGFVAVLAALGADTSELAAASPESPIDRIVRAIEEQQQAAGSAIAGVSVEQTAPLLLASVLGGDEASAQELVEAMASGELVPDTTRDPRSVVPEPGTLLLVAAGVGAMGVRRRR